MKAFITLVKADLLRWWRAGMLWAFLLLVLAFAGGLGLLMHLHLGVNRARFVYELGQLSMSVFGALVLVFCLFPRLQEGSDGEGAFWLSQPINRYCWGLAHGFSACLMAGALVAVLLGVWLWMLPWAVGEAGALPVISCCSVFGNQLLGLLALGAIVFLVTGIFHSSALAAVSVFLWVSLGLLSDRFGVWSCLLADLSRYQLPFEACEGMDWSLLWITAVQAIIMIFLGLWFSGKKD